MRELLSSILRFSWAMSLFGVRQMARALTPGNGSLAGGFDTVAAAAATEMDGSVRALYEAGAQFQSGVVNGLSSGSPPAPGPDGTGPQPLRPAASGRLDTSKFVVLGEGLAAGMSDFSLSSDTQVYSFPAQMAQR